MTERKFTPPTEFPAEYVTEDEQKVVVLGRAPVGDYPLIGYILHAEGERAEPDCWTEKGSMFTMEEALGGDLHDIPKRISTWHNVYNDGWIGNPFFTRKLADEHYDACKALRPRPRLCVYRIERDEDGGNHEMFKEEV